MLNLVEDAAVEVGLGMSMYELHARGEFDFMCMDMWVLVCAPIICWVESTKEKGCGPHRNSHIGLDVIVIG